MANIHEDFDQYQRVKYTDASHLFWGVYPFKVIFRTPYSKSYYRDEKDFFKDKATLRDQIIDPDPSVVFKINASGNGFSYFFRDRADAEAFIDLNRNFVSEVVRPRTTDAITAMLTDRTVRVRDSLFFRQFRWMVAFDTFEILRPCEVTRECDAWVEEFFCLDGRQPGVHHASDEEGRVLYHYGTQRKLYLRHDADMMAVRLVLDRHIKQVEYVVLASEVAVEPSLDIVIERHQAA